MESTDILKKCPSVSSRRVYHGRCHVGFKARRSLHSQSGDCFVFESNVCLKIEMSDAHAFFVQTDAS